jgi:hypothetical protein
MPATLALAPFRANAFGLVYQFEVIVEIQTNPENSVMNYLPDFNHLGWRLIVQI